MHPANPVPSAQTGALIARIGNGQPFLVGTQTRLVAPTAGQLFLGINDSHVADNQGAYQVEVQRAGRTRR
jgi:ABC-type antimicrobial peptide transport system ATPase subunit